MEATMRFFGDKGSAVTRFTYRAGKWLAIVCVGNSTSVSIVTKPYIDDLYGVTNTNPLYTWERR